MEYMTAKEAAQKWNITVRRVQVLMCAGADSRGNAAWKYVGFAY
jgi:hypothetical protein